ncbi:MAG: ABC transporter permease [Clostridia bacterium]|jgi:ribose transport system permease protein/erythritol transport system permease protein|nr:ABC transporter permease [Clostridia bacterium]MBR2662870.1 ABC transporter permease [Clostridia bacterium]
MKKNNNQLLMTLLKGRTFIVLILLVIFFSFASSSFLQLDTLTMVAKHVSLYGILALGMTFVIITGGIDLSVGSVVGLVGMLAGGLIQEGLTIGGKTIYFSVPAVIVLMLLFGCLVGLINGLIITKLNVAAFIATLGTMYICRGFANLRSGGATFTKIGGYEGLGNMGLKSLGSNWFGVPAGVYVFAVLAVLSAILLKRTDTGWHILAVGGNEKSARLSGIKSDRVKILVYIISGFCAAWIGLINTAQISAAHPASGDGWEMNAIAATVLGGTSMAGGSGTIVGTIVGAFVIGVINDGMTMCGVTEFWQKIIRGLVIILAVVIDQTQRNLQAKMALQARNEMK